MPSLPFHSGLSCVLFHNLLLTVLDYKSLVVLAYLLTCDVVDGFILVGFVGADAVDACRGFFVGELDGKALMVILVWCKVMVSVIVLNLEVAAQNVCCTVGQTDSGFSVILMMSVLMSVAVKLCSSPFVVTFVVYIPPRSGVLAEPSAVVIQHCRFDEAATLEMTVVVKPVMPSTLTSPRSLLPLLYTLPSLLKLIVFAVPSTLRVMVAVFSALNCTGGVPFWNFTLKLFSPFL